MGIRCAPPALGVRLPTGAGMRSLKGGVMPKFTKIERPSTPREAYELLRSSKTACVMGGAGCGRVFSIAGECQKTS